ncbi:MAG: hypothetical protein U5K37_02870 [Natrialbaceae archaeon]|nr:hypothetical protein [Natrialbaceae archaeon]
MDFDAIVTGGIFVLVIALGVGGMIASGMMPTNTVLMMVLPSMVIFGALLLGVGIKHGQYRATN